MLNGLPEVAAPMTEVVVGINHRHLTLVRFFFQSGDLPGSRQRILVQLFSAFEFRSFIMSMMTSATLTADFCGWLSRWRSATIQQRCSQTSIDRRSRQVYDGLTGAHTFSPFPFCGPARALLPRRKEAQNLAHQPLSLIRAEHELSVRGAVEDDQFFRLRR